MTWAVKHRPSSFSEMVGNPLSLQVLHSLSSGGHSVPSGFLFSGPSGTGKTTAARLLAYSLCQDVIEIDAASARGIDTVRDIVSSLRYVTSGSYRVVILDEAHNLTSSAFDALLKTLEEPPVGSVFILVTTSPHLIPDTVRSRLFEFEFPRVSETLIASRLQEVALAEEFSVSEELLDEIARKASGSVRAGLMFLEKCFLAGVSTAEEFNTVVGSRDAAVPLLVSLAYGNSKDVRDSFDLAVSVTSDPQEVVSQLTHTLADFLVIRAGEAVDGAEIGTKEELAWRFTHEQIIEALNFLWEMRTRIPSSSSKRADAELVVFLIHEILCLTQNNQESSDVALDSSSDDVLSLHEL